MKFRITGSKFIGWDQFTENELLQGFPAHVLQEDNTNSIALYHGGVKLGYIPNEISSIEKNRLYILKRKVLFFRVISRNETGSWTIEVSDENIPFILPANPKQEHTTYDRKTFKIRISKSDFNRTQLVYNYARVQEYINKWESLPKYDYYTDDFDSLLEVLKPWSYLTVKDINNTKFLLYTLYEYDEMDFREEYCISFSNYLQSLNLEGYIVKEIIKIDSYSFELTLYPGEAAKPFTQEEDYSFRSLLRKYYDVEFPYSAHYPFPYSLLSQSNISFNQHSKYRTMYTSISKTNRHYYLLVQAGSAHLIHSDDEQGYEKRYVLLNTLADYLNEKTSLSFEVSKRFVSDSLYCYETEYVSNEPTLYLQQKYSLTENKNRIIEDLIITKDLLSGISDRSFSLEPDKIELVYLDQDNEIKEIIAKLN